MKNVIIAVLSTALVFMTVTSYLAMRVADRARVDVESCDNDILSLLALNAKFEASNDVCMAFVEKKNEDRKSFLQEVTYARNGEVRSRPRRAHKGGARVR